MYRRPIYFTVHSRLKEPRKFIQVLTGPRQTGKTTLIRQITDDLDIPYHYASADEPTLQSRIWIEQRFEIIPAVHWSYTEMKDAFGWTFEQYVYFGGYPGSAGLINDRHRWSRYIVDSFIEITI